jgi:hypothetical protein
MIDIPARRRVFRSALGLLSGIVAGVPAQSEKLMSPTAAAEPAYFARAKLYSLPIRPELPISESEAERGRSFYRFAIEGGRVQWAEKWLVDRAPERADFQTPSSLTPGVHVFSFAPESGAVRPMNLSGIRELSKYLRVEVFADGRPALVERVSRQRVMRHDYTYWENGKLRQWRYLTDTDQGEEQFDQAGEPRR